MLSLTCPNYGISTNETEFAFVGEVHDIRRMGGVSMLGFFERLKFMTKPVHAFFNGFYRHCGWVFSVGNFGSQFCGTHFGFDKPSKEPRYKTGKYRQKEPITEHITKLSDWRNLFNSEVRPC